VDVWFEVKNSCFVLWRQLMNHCTWTN